jgi:hypothetical protein
MCFFIAYRTLRDTPLSPDRFPGFDRLTPRFAGWLGAWGVGFSFVHEDCRQVIFQKVSNPRATSMYLLLSLDRFPLPGFARVPSGQVPGSWVAGCLGAGGSFMRIVVKSFSKSSIILELLLCLLVVVTRPFSVTGLRTCPCGTVPGSRVPGGRGSFMRTVIKSLRTFYLLPLNS